MFNKIDFDNLHNQFIYLWNRLKKLQTKYTEVKFGLASKEEWTQINQIFSLSKDIELVGVGVFKHNKFEGNLFKDGEFNFQEIENFIQGFINGTLPPYIKSQTLEDLYEDGIRILTGKSLMPYL